MLIHERGTLDDREVRGLLAAEHEAVLDADGEELPAWEEMVEGV
jgi:hypothetical protein